MTTNSSTNYLTNGHTVKSWLLTVDHKRIAILYLLSVTAFFVIGGIFAVLLRLAYRIFNICSDVAR